MIVYVLECMIETAIINAWKQAEMHILRLTDCDQLGDIPCQHLLVQTLALKFMRSR